MNHATRYRCLEVPINDAEHEGITATCKLLGLPKAVFARLSMAHIMANDAPLVLLMESRQHRDTPVASRASSGIKPLGGGGGIKCPGKRGAARPRNVRLL